MLSTISINTIEIYIRIITMSWSRLARIRGREILIGRGHNILVGKCVHSIRISKCIKRYEIQNPHKTFNHDMYINVTQITQKIISCWRKLYFARESDHSSTRVGKQTFILWFSTYPINNIIYHRVCQHDMRVGGFYN